MTVEPSRRGQSYRTLIAPALLIPLGPLLDSLEGLSGSLGGNDVQVAVHEYDVSSAIFLVLGAVLDATYQWLKIDDPEYSHHDERTDIYDYVGRRFDSSTQWSRDEFEDALARIDEVIAVRNSVAHCHLWEGRYDAKTMTWIEGPRRRTDFASENKRHKRTTSGETRTRLLALNVLPTKVGRADIARALPALHTFGRLLRDHLDHHALHYMNSDETIRFRGDFHSIRSLASLLADEWKVAN